MRVNYSEDLRTPRFVLEKLFTPLIGVKTFSTLMANVDKVQQKLSETKLYSATNIMIYPDQNAESEAWQYEDFHSTPANLVVGIDLHEKILETLSIVASASKSHSFSFVIPNTIGLLDQTTFEARYGPSSAFGVSKKTSQH